MKLDVEFLAPDSVKAKLLAELMEENRLARRTTRMDNLGRENAEWAERHVFINILLTLLEE